MSDDLIRGANPWASPGQWFRGTLHAHTTNSDGAMPPTKLDEHYAYSGADFIALTDHWKATGRDDVLGDLGPTLIRRTR